MVFIPAEVMALKHRLHGLASLRLPVRLILTTYKVQPSALSA